jgi:hypothetical protein
MAQDHAGVPGPPRVTKAPSYTPSTSDCVVDGDQRKRSARSPRPPSLPSITCLRTVHSTTISALPTSIAGAPKRRHAASSSIWPSLAFPLNSSLWQPPHEPPVFYMRESSG